MACQHGIISCGYTGHVCDIWTGRVQFISRYRFENDYCVGGKRVSVSDNGTTRNGTTDDIEKIRQFETEREAGFLAAHKAVTL
jgi:hypothetical protein